MQWQVGDVCQWHPVPYAWIPAHFDYRVYWLEQPPYERRLKWSHVEDVYEYRKAVAVGPLT